MTKNKNLLTAIIFTVGLRIASFFFAYSQRYEFFFRSNNNVIILVEIWKHKNIVVSSELRIIQ